MYVHMYMYSMCIIYNTYTQYNIYVCLYICMCIYMYELYVTHIHNICIYKTICIIGILRKHHRDGLTPFDIDVKIS